MLTNIKSYRNLSPILLFVIFLYLSLTVNRVLLADDLAMVYNGVHNKKGFFDFLSAFMSSTNMTSRPVSALFTGIVIFLTKYSILFYYSGFLFFLLSLFSVWKLSLELTKNNYISTILTCFYALIPIGTSIVFSPIMLNSALATLFFCLSVTVFLRKKKKFYIWSAVLFLLSFLSYEIFAPCIIIFLFLSADIRSKLFFYLYAVSLLLIYKKGVEPYLFANYYQREKLQAVFSIHKSYSNILLISKLLFRDFPTVLYKGILSVAFFSIWDWIAVLAFNISSYFVLKGLKLKAVTALNIRPVCITFLLSFAIFFASTYKPTLFGFDNRNLGAIRLFFVLVFVLGLLQFRLREKSVKVIFSAVLIIFSISSISAKNAWIYASEFNTQIFQKVKRNIEKEGHLVTGKIYITYDVFKTLKTDPHFLLREQIFYYPWESPYLMDINGIHGTEIKLKEDNVPIEYPHYLFDYEKNTFVLKKAKLK